MQAFFRLVDLGGYLIFSESLGLGKTLKRQVVNKRLELLSKLVDRRSNLDMNRKLFIYKALNKTDMNKKCTLMHLTKYPT